MNNPSSEILTLLKNYFFQGVNQFQVLFQFNQIWGKPREIQQ